MKIEIDIEDSLYERIRMLTHLLEEDINRYIKEITNDSLKNDLDNFKRENKYNH